MALYQSQYQDVRDRMRPGDLIAFGGTGIVSDVIKVFTRSPVSHVGIVLDTKLVLDGQPQDGRIVQVIESTTLNGQKGVQINRMSARIEQYNGQIWWMPMAAPVRAELNLKAFMDFCLNEDHKPYNGLGAVLAGLHLWEPDTQAREFCSQLWADSLRHGAVKEMQKVNPPSVTPAEACSFKLHSAEYHQIKGVAKEIPGYNSKILD